MALLCTIAVGRFLSGGWLWFLKCCESCEKDRFSDNEMDDDEIEAAYLKEFEAKHGGLKDAADAADDEKSVPPIVTATTSDHPEQAPATRNNRSSDDTVDTSDPSTDERPMSPNQGSHGNVEEADDEVDEMMSPQTKTPKAYKKYWASDESESEVGSTQVEETQTAAPTSSVVQNTNVQVPDSPITAEDGNETGSGPNVWPPVMVPDFSTKDGADSDSEDITVVEEFQDEAGKNVVVEAKTQEAPPSPPEPVHSTTTQSAVNQLYADEEDDEDIPLPPDDVLLNAGLTRAPLKREAPPRRPPTRSDNSLPRGNSYTVHSVPLAPMDDDKPSFTMAELRSFGISKLKAMCKQYEIVYDMHEIFEKEDLVQVLVKSGSIHIKREAPTRSRSADAVDMGDMRSSLMMAPSRPRSMSRERVSKPRRAKSADLTSMADAAAASSSPKKSSTHSSRSSRSSHRSSSRDKTRSSSHDRHKSSSKSKSSSRSKVKRSSSSDDVLLATAAAARNLTSSPSSESKSSSKKKKSSSSSKGSLDRKLSRSKSDDLAGMRKASSSAKSTSSHERSSRRSKSKDRSSKSKRRSRSTDDALSRKSKRDKGGDDDDEEEEDGYDAFENEIFGED